MMNLSSKMIQNLNRLAIISDETAGAIPSTHINGSSQEMHPSTLASMARRGWATKAGSSRLYIITAAGLAALSA